MYSAQRFCTALESQDVSEVFLAFKSEIAVCATVSEKNYRDMPKGVSLSIVSFLDSSVATLAEDVGTSTLKGIHVPPPANEDAKTLCMALGFLSSVFTTERGAR